MFLIDPLENNPGAAIACSILISESFTIAASK